MTSWGHILLLVSFVASGYAATACFGADRDVRRNLRSRLIGGVIGVGSLSLACGLLAYALVTKDFSFALVAKYSHASLPWHYSLSAFWVGQAGSLLLWCWLSGATALAFCVSAKATRAALRARAFGIQMALVACLAGIMIFAADPMRANVVSPPTGEGLNPVLQHPIMLSHPPIVFLAYAFWSVPFSLALAALMGASVDSNWIPDARRWALAAWTTLGIGILLGAKWAYEELGWGGYWAWDPVENGSLIPWLTGTALLHLIILWQYRGVLKKTCLAMAIATFAFCLFATFLTRSGLFSSLHAFSHSPIGWLFLFLILAVVGGGGALILRRRSDLLPERRISSMFSRESVLIIAMVAVCMLAVVTTAGTLVGPLSGLLFGQSVVLGPEFYNNVLLPVGIVLAFATPMAPLLRWGKPPGRVNGRLIFASLGLLGGLFMALLFQTAIHPLVLALGLLAIWSVASPLLRYSKVSGTVSPAARRGPRTMVSAPFLNLLDSLRSNRVQFAAYIMHSGFMMAVVSIAASSLGTLRHDVRMAEGSRIEFAGYSIFHAGVQETKTRSKMVAETKLHISHGDRRPFILKPGQNFHPLANQWTTEVAIHSTWGRDFYALAHGGEAETDAGFSFMINPMMRWLWTAGWVCGLGAVIRLWPARHRKTPPPQSSKRLPARRPKRRVSGGQ